MNRINFILPYKPKRPTGGVKMMYEYANRLAKKGYKVHIYYPLKTGFINYRFPFIVRWLLSKIEGFNTYRWFQFDSSITMSYINRVADKYIADADIIIATWWATASEMGKLSASKGKKINYIQGFENWAGHEDLLYESYRIEGATNVVIASFLKEIINKYSDNPTIVIENAIDNGYFKVIEPIKKRKSLSICMNYSSEPIKGSLYGIEALKIVKEQFQDVSVDMFSIYPRPDDLPEWISFYQTPDDLAAVYNNNAIFISNSFTEGFGLVSVEAMACGCALICTDIPGHREFAIDGETALLVSAEDSERMAVNILKLIENNDLRIKLAEAGNDYVKKYSWDVATQKMEQVVKGLLNE